MRTGTCGLLGTWLVILFDIVWTFSGPAGWGNNGECSSGNTQISMLAKITRMTERAITEWRVPDSAMVSCENVTGSADQFKIRVKWLWETESTIAIPVPTQASWVPDPVTNKLTTKLPNFTTTYSVTPEETKTETPTTSPDDASAPSSLPTIPPEERDPQRVLQERIDTIIDNMGLGTSTLETSTTEESSTTSSISASNESTLKTTETSLKPEATTGVSDESTTGSSVSTTGVSTITTGVSTLTTDVTTGTSLKPETTTGVSDESTTGSSASTTVANTITTAVSTLTTDVTTGTSLKPEATTGVSDEPTTGSSSSTTGASTITTGVSTLTTIVRTSTADASTSTNEASTLPTDSSSTDFTTSTTDVSTSTTYVPLLGFSEGSHQQSTIISDGTTDVTALFEVGTQSPDFSESLKSKKISEKMKQSSGVIRSCHPYCDNEDIETKMFSEKYANSLTFTITRTSSLYHVSEISMLFSIPDEGVFRRIYWKNANLFPGPVDSTHICECATKLPLTSSETYLVLQNVTLAAFLSQDKIDFPESKADCNTKYDNDEVNQFCQTAEIIMITVGAVVGVLLLGGLAFCITKLYLKSKREGNARDSLP